LFSPPQVEELLESLDRGRSYFSVVHFAGLLEKERIAVPCDLKLTLFVGGGPDDAAWAPHVKYLPIPLLLKARGDLTLQTLINEVHIIESAFRRELYSRAASLDDGAWTLRLSYPPTPSAAECECSRLMSNDAAALHLRADAHVSAPLHL